MKIVIAPNAFKHALQAEEVADAITAGLERSGLIADLVTLPIGDGGDGTGRLLAKHFHAAWVPTSVKDPLGKVIESGFYFGHGESIAIVEMADASGIRLLQKSELNPLVASSFGTGQLLAAALKTGVKKILLCVGGSATVDGGVGILRALGVELLNRGKNPIGDFPVGLKNLHQLEFSRLDKRLMNVELVILTDVRNPLLGPNGAVRIFAPQKGASLSDVLILEESMSRLAEVVSAQKSVNIGIIERGGAAGGVAATLHGVLGAKLVSGIDYFLDVSGFDKALAGADLVITGEGKLDRQTLDGKGPLGVASRAKKIGVRVIAMAGEIEDVQELSSFFDEVVDINAGHPDSKDLLLKTRRRLTESALSIGLKISGG